MLTNEHIADECLNVLNQLCERLGENMESEECKKLITHLESCPNCEKYVESLRKTIQVYKKTREEAPDTVVESLCARIKKELESTDKLSN